MNLLSTMRYLVALSEQQHFGRAAEHCHITQPALSNAIRALEAELGVTIVKRTRLFRGFTDEGALFLERARRMLKEEQLLRQDMATPVSATEGRLTLGAVPSAMRMAAAFLASLRQTHPGIQGVLRSMSTPQIRDELDNLNIDMALGYAARTTQSGPKLTMTPQYHETYYLLQRNPVPGAQGLEIGSPVPWSQAAGLPLCLLDTSMHHRQRIDEAFAEVDASPAPVIETDTISALAYCVESGELATILPGALLCQPVSRIGLRAHPLTQPDFSTPIGFMTNAEAPPSRIVTAALEYAESECWRAALAPLLPANVRNELFSQAA